MCLASHQVADNPDQVAPHGAADATIIHLKDFFIGIDHQLVINSNFAKLVNDDGDFFAVFVGENAIQQRGFACTQVTCE